MPTSFQTLQSTRIDDLLIGLAKIGLISGMLYGVNAMQIHTVQTSGHSVEFRRKDEDQTEAQQRRELRKAMREADKTKQARNRYREMKRAEYRAKWNRLTNQAQRDTIILTVNVQ